MTTQKRALLVLTSHGDLGGLRPTGWYVSEAAHPWQALTDAGVEVDLASVAGGQPPMDGRDESDAVQNAFLNDPHIAAELADTPALDAVDPGAYDAVLYVGGHGTMWDFPGNPQITRISRDIWEDGGVVAAVCHGPSALVDVTLSDGSYLVDGHTVAGFTNDEEAAVGLTDVVPFLLADELERRGARHTAGANFTEHVEVSDRLVTGQNPQSAGRVGREIATLLAG